MNGAKVQLTNYLTQGRKWLTKSGGASSNMAAMAARHRCRRHLLFCQKVGGQLLPLPPLQLRPCHMYDLGVSHTFHFHKKITESSVIFLRNDVLILNGKENKEASAICFEIRIPKKKNAELFLKVPSERA